MQLIPASKPSSPTLINVHTVTNTIPKTRYSLYYQNPIFPTMYKPIDQIQQLQLVSPSLKFKILDLEEPNKAPSMREAEFNFLAGGHAQLRVEFGGGELQLKGKVVNQGGNGVVFAIRVLEIDGLDGFMKFRYKYRTLENITRKQNFKLDHRLKIIDGPTTFYFPLQQSDTSTYFFTSPHLTLQLQQIHSIQDYQTVTSIHQQQLDLTEQKGSMTATMNILQKLKIKLFIQMIKNQNFSNSEIACLRVLEVGPGVGQLRIGTDSVGEMGKVQPVMGGNFYDYQFAYMVENLKGDGLGEVYDSIQKLTKSFPKYPHLKNSKLLSITSSKFLIFTFKADKPAKTQSNSSQSVINTYMSLQAKSQTKIQIPLVYILRGLNIIETETHKIKFYIEFDGEEKQYKTQSGDLRRVYCLKLQDIWNLGTIAKGYGQFIVKIITPKVNYYIPFTSQQVDLAAYRKQAKQLQFKQQYSQLKDNQLYILTQSPTPNKLTLTKTTEISQIYILDLINSSPITFQLLSSSSQILLQGIVPRQKITSIPASKNTPLRVILSSPDSLTKVALTFNHSQVTFKNKSYRTYYQVMYKLEFGEQVPCDGVCYDMEVRRGGADAPADSMGGGAKKKKYRVKVEPEIADDGVSTLHKLDGGFYEKTDEDLELIVVLKKMYYNQETEVYDNSELVSKKIIVNPVPTKSMEDQLFLAIKQQGFNSLQFDFYDQTIKKRLKLHIQIIMYKHPLLDQQPGKYILRIPQQLSPQIPIQNLTLQIHHSNRKKTSKKLTAYPDSPQQYSLPHYNYKDGLCVRINDEVGYERMIDLLRGKCDVRKGTVVWVEESLWELGVVNVGQWVFWVLVKWEYGDGSNSDDQDGDGDQSPHAKTRHKANSENANSQIAKSTAKTVKIDQITKLKQQRNNLVLQGRNLTTNFVKKQQQIIKLTRKIQYLKQKLQKQKALQRQSTSALSTNPSGLKPNPGNKQKLSKFYRSICQCGQKNPQYHGFCQTCLKQLKRRYQTYLKQYKQKSYQYERLYFNKFNSKQKYFLVKNKFEYYKARIKEGKDIEDDTVDFLSRGYQDSELKRKIEETKIAVFRLTQEREKLEENARLRLEGIEGLIRKEDEEIIGQMREMQRLQMQMEELESRINKNKQQ